LGPFSLRNAQEISMKRNTKPKYLMVMDLDDADSDLRESKNVLMELEKERETLVKWGFSREIPAELWEEIHSAKKEVNGMKREVEELEKRLKNYGTA